MSAAQHNVCEEENAKAAAMKYYGSLRTVPDWVWNLREVQDRILKWGESTHTGGLMGLTVQSKDEKETFTFEYCGMSLDQVIDSTIAFLTPGQEENKEKEEDEEKNAVTKVDDRKFLALKEYYQENVQGGDVENFTTYKELYDHILENDPCVQCDANILEEQLKQYESKENGPLPSPPGPPKKKMRVRLCPMATNPERPPAKKRKQVDTKKEEELFFVVDSNGLQLRSPETRTVDVVSIRSTLFKKDVNAAIQNNTRMDKQTILGYPRGVVVDWVDHPEVSRHLLSEFDQATTLTLNNQSKITPRQYFDGALIDSPNQGYALKNSVQDSVVHGGPVGFFVMKITSTDKKEVQRKMFMDVVKSICQEE